MNKPGDYSGPAPDFFANTTGDKLAQLAEWKCYGCGLTFPANNIPVKRTINNVEQTFCKSCGLNSAIKEAENESA